MSTLKASLSKNSGAFPVQFAKGLRRNPGNCDGNLPFLMKVRGGGTFFGLVMVKRDIT